MMKRFSVWRARGEQKGFTFVELLVAGFIGAVVLVVTYLVFTANSRQYYVQEQIVQMQESMRFAVEYLKNDLRSAGRLSVVNGIERFDGRNQDGRDPQFCRFRSGYQAIELLENRATPNVLRRFDNLLIPDRLRLLVDASGGAPLTINRIQGQTVNLEIAERQLTPASRRLVSNQTTFEAIFKGGYFLYVITRTGESDIVPIQVAEFNEAGPRIRVGARFCALDGGATLASKCFGGDCFAVPIQWVEYAVAAEENNEEKTRLERRILNANTGNVVPDSTLNLADFIVDFQIWGTYDTRPLRPTLGSRVTMAEDENPTDDIGNWVTAREDAIMNVRPDRIRALNILLATRTEREDRGYLVAPEKNMAPQERVLADRTWFELDRTPGTGYARVITLRTEVETPNMYRGQ